MLIQARTQTSSQPTHELTGRAPARSSLWLVALILAYMGVYLCRKNFAVAIPMLEREFGASRAELGWIASASTLTYAVGKFLFGPVIDRLGGRFCFFCSLLLVALFGAAGALVSTLPMLAACYSASRLAGSGTWGSMMKLVPDWFSARELPFAIAVLSLSFVFGGACASVFAGQVAEWSGNNWKMVMGVPSLVLALLVTFSWLVLPSRAAVPERSTLGWSDPGETKAGPAPVDGPSTSGHERGSYWREFLPLWKIQQFWVVCALSFAITLMRETFNNWTVDFFRAEGGVEMSNRLAAFLSMPFDACGALGIVSLGWVFGRVGHTARRRILFWTLSCLAAVVWTLPHLFRHGLWLPTAAVASIGFLVYGPYSLLAGVFSLEIRGKEHVGTVAGVVDGVGYLAGILAGQQFGWVVDVGGYRTGFHILAVFTAGSALLCLLLYRKKA